MKKIIGIILSFLMLFSLMSCDDEPYVSPDKTPTSTWDGTSATIEWYTNAEDGATSYTLKSASDLAGLAQLVNKTTGDSSISSAVTFEGKTITLAVNVDLNGKEWTPIGKGARDGKAYTTGSTPFKGTFDGKGLKISNLTITNGESSACIGLFGIVDGGNIKNLKLTNVCINAESCENVGTVVGLMMSEATLDNVTVGSSNTSENSTVNGAGAGGLVGRITVSGKISNCTNYATVTGGAEGTGGIVLKAYYQETGKSISITNCKNYGNVKSENKDVGGIAGFTVSTDIEGCYNEGTVTGKGESVAGIVGEIRNKGYVKNSENRGKITNNGTGYGTGGIVGWIRYLSGSGTIYNPVEISGNKNFGVISSNGTGAGGIVGILYNAGEISSNTNNAQSLTGYDFVSGIVGGYQNNTDTGSTYNGDDGYQKTKISKNTSVTTLDNITSTTSCKAVIIYDNSSGKITITDNTPSTNDKATE